MVSNATFSLGDLWESLEEASGKQVGKVMHTWTAQMGFPVLKVTDKQVGNWFGHVIR